MKVLILPSSLFLTVVKIRLDMTDTPSWRVKNIDTTPILFDKQRPWKYNSVQLPDSNTIGRLYIYADQALNMESEGSKT
jgi:hypothetical protein